MMQAFSAYFAISVVQFVCASATWAADFGIPRPRPLLREPDGAILASPEEGTVLHFPEFNLQQPGAVFFTDGRPVWKFVPDFDGRPAYVLEFADRRYDPFIDWSTSALHPVPLQPNRTYTISVLLYADFPRPAEVNLGVKLIDHAGKQVIWSLNGLPNNTGGWKRWEWDFVTDPRTVAGVFSVLLIELPLKDSVLALGEVALVERPPRPVEPFRPGEGATFPGGPGALPMQIVDVRQEEAAISVDTTGASYTFLLNENTIVCRQRLEQEREVVRWRSSLPLVGLQCLRQSPAECVLANRFVTFGIQCDSLVVVVPHAELALTATSAIGGRWNRLAVGHLFCVDDFGGFAVNPIVPAGSGRLARVHIGKPWQGLEPGRRPPGGVDFSGRVDDQIFLSQAPPGWEITWFVSPGERLAWSVFPPRPYPWKESFEFSWLLAHRKDRVDGYPARQRGPQHVEVLWDFFQRGWAMSWGSRHEPYDEKLLVAHIEAIHKAGSLAVVYASPNWYYSRDPEEFIAEMRRLRDTYGIDGVYYDGIPSQDWPLAYTLMRMTRELFPEGPVILHNTGQAYNGNPPLGEPSIRIPAVETYATATFGGELVYGVGADWPFLRYSVSQYRLANCIGAMKGDAWEGLTPLQKHLAMLRVNGRNPYRLYPREYFQVLEQLRELWQKHGHKPNFFEEYYLPSVHKWTAFAFPDEK
ncbi:MAG: hypothetical protein NZ899_15215 [Thermoguttaceae bacterium]|nr:hypothetical protein [Thermoguttaceae bacterium]